MRVLLVDDHRLLIEGLSNLLSAHGVEVLGIAGDGLEAVAMARQLSPDLILMDIRMPRCDGLSATRQIKALFPDLKIVMLTTSSDDQDLFEAVKSGAAGYLLKSIGGDAFMEQREVEAVVQCCRRFCSFPARWVDARDRHSRSPTTHRSDRQLAC